MCGTPVICLRLEQECFCGRRGAQRSFCLNVFPASRRRRACALAQPRAHKVWGQDRVMKLAEALLLRADIQKKLATLQARAQRYAVVQEGEQPAENPQVILQQVQAVADELQRLVFAINRANLRHKIASGETLTEALAKRDCLAQRHRILQSVVDVCAKPPDRYGVKEIRWVTTVDVAALQAQIDDLAKQIRELNAAIQEAGWKVELKH